MFLGVPYTPFFIAAGICLALAAYINIFMIALLPVAIMILRQIARQDEMIFHLWGLKMRFATKVRNRGKLQNMIVFSPNLYRDRPPPK